MKDYTWKKSTCIQILYKNPNITVSSFLQYKIVESQFQWSKVVLNFCGLWLFWRVKLGLGSATKYPGVTPWLGRAFTPHIAFKPKVGGLGWALGPKYVVRPIWDLGPQFGFVVHKNRLQLV